MHCGTCTEEQRPLVANYLLIQIEDKKVIFNCELDLNCDVELS